MEVLTEFPPAHARTRQRARTLTEFKPATPARPSRNQPPSPPGSSYVTDFSAAYAPYSFGSSFATYFGSGAHPTPVLASPSAQGSVHDDPIAEEEGGAFWGRAPCAVALPFCAAMRRHRSQLIRACAHPLPFASCSSRQIGPATFPPSTPSTRVAPPWRTRGRAPMSLRTTSCPCRRRRGWRR
jgi:hypothetical protein